MGKEHGPSARCFTGDQLALIGAKYWVLVREATITKSRLVEREGKEDPLGPFYANLG